MELNDLKWEWFYDAFFCFAFSTITRSLIVRTSCTLCGAFEGIHITGNFINFNMCVLFCRL